LSGIVGIFRRRGIPVERSILQSLTNSLQYRGPDGQEVWADGPIGFGHTMLRTTPEAAGEHQPASLEGRLWITADSRIDCRAGLVGDLSQAGRTAGAAATDPELILHAYDVWGESCVLYLRGDFAFAIWDAPRKKLFCARDHFGIKPFFYAAREDLFLFSNTLNCLRAHPQVSDELNEAAIGDFLLFGLNCDTATTTFAGIQRLPAAHFLTVSSSELRTQRYWSPPIDGRIRYNRTEEYAEHFHEILKAAVADRLRTRRVGILLSGGLDSGAVAATARELRASHSEAQDLRAYTMVHETLFDDREGVYARQTAEHLQIPIELLAAEEPKAFERWDDPARLSPEPVDDPFYGGHFAEFKRIASDCRVVLSGEGPDNLMDFQMWPYARDLLRRREWATFVAEMGRFLWVRPFPWRGLRERLRHFAGKDAEERKFPAWIASDFGSRLDLAKRWENPLIGPLIHPVLPRAHASLALPHWNRLFEYADPGVTRCPVEVRYPFLDLRMVNYLLGLPPFPWFFQKRLLRKAMASRLPEITRLRAKTPLAVHPLVELLQREGNAWLDDAGVSGEIERYVNVSRLESIRGQQSPERAYVTIRPLCLNFWLQSARKVRYNLETEVL